MTIETHKNGSDGKDWVWIRHPEIDSVDPAEVTLEAFEEVWADNGFKIVSAPVEEAASDDTGGTKADNSDGTAPSHGRGHPKAKAVR